MESPIPEHPAASGSSPSAATPSTTAEEFPELYFELATADHFWVQWRWQACRQLLSDTGLPTGQSLRGLEIGCAHGIVQRQLASSTRWTIDGCDLNRAALAQNDSGSGRIFYYDIHERRAELREAYDFLVLFDVLEHIADATAFLRSALYHLHPGGFLLVNVPALMLLYSGYDAVQGHRRRYRRRTLSAELRAAGLDPVEVRYWGFSLVPLLVARRAVTALQRSPETVYASGFEPPGRAFSAVMRALMRLETAVSTRPPLGTSVMALARKPRGDSRAGGSGGRS